MSRDNDMTNQPSDSRERTAASVPPASDLNDRIAALSPVKRALLEQRLRNYRANGLKPTIRPRNDRQKPMPLSFGQQRLWFLDQLEPNSSLYNIAKAARLRGPLEIEALRLALADLARRHEVLRTTFIALDGEPAQIVHDDRSVELAVVDLSARSQAEREQIAEHSLHTEAKRPFDLSHDSLLRATLVRLADEDHLLLLVMHHIASDGWSMSILSRELSALYNARRNGGPPQLPPLPIQYADFAAWQRAELEGDKLLAQLAYWKTQLAGCAATLNLPCDRPRPVAPSHRGANRSFVVPPDLSEKLHALSRMRETTVFMTLLAAFNVFLWRQTGQEDLLVATPVAGRNRSELEPLIGFFVNTLVLRTKLSGDLTFNELLGRARETVVGALAHQDLPFEKLVEALNPKRDGTSRALAQVAFAFQNVPREPLNLSGIELTPVQIDSAQAKLDLTLFMWESGAGLAGTLNYSTDLFDASTIERMLGDFQRVLERAASHPERAIADLAPSPATRAAPISPVGSESPAVADFAQSNLSANQLLIWAGQKLQPETPLYNGAYAFTLHGAVDRAHFENAFQTVVNSADALRTVIDEIEGVPQQRVQASMRCALEHLDFSDRPDPGEAFDAWLENRRRLRFDLSERLLDSALVKIGDATFVWYLNLHHIIVDGWSIGLIFRRVADLYALSLQGRLPERIDLPPYRDYLEYERKHRQSRAYAEAKAHWRRKLAQPGEPIRFYGQPAVKRTSRIRRISRVLEGARSNAFRRILAHPQMAAVTSRASAFNAFAALLFTYLHRASGNRQLTVGTPVHNR
ncbi:MAG TPA: condensation domain-containing protein, partial [Candidatus Eisenbacteria bacterium]|nr:condensation domain-containing protein [Candidatus Eisenbacteria bacterium]